MPSVCPKPLAETLLSSIIGGLLLEGRVPNGSVVNAGAARGDFSCFYAEQVRVCPVAVHLCASMSHV